MEQSLSVHNIKFRLKQNILNKGRKYKESGTKTILKMLHSRLNFNITDITSTDYKNKDF